jgi:hypothetical protein
MEWEKSIQFINTTNNTKDNKIKIGKRCYSVTAVKDQIYLGGYNKVIILDINGRDAILKVHMQKLPIAKNVKSINIAKGTPGFSGADLANLCNEALGHAQAPNAQQLHVLLHDKLSFLSRHHPSPCFFSRHPS